MFARASQVHALHRWLSEGRTKQAYIKRQRAWAIGMGLLAAIFIVAATYYNLVIRPTMGA